MLVLATALMLSYRVTVLTATAEAAYSVVVQEVPLPIESRAALQKHLLQQGFSLGVASWITSNLRPSQDDPR